MDAQERECRDDDHVVIETGDGRRMVLTHDIEASTRCLYEVLRPAELDALVAALKRLQAQR